MLCGWSIKKKFFIHFRMLKFYFRHGVIVERFHEIISFKQSKCLEKKISFNTKKTKQTKNDLEKDFYK